MGPSSWKDGEGSLLDCRKSSILTVFVRTDAASFAISDAILGYFFAIENILSTWSRVWKTRGRKITSF